MLGAIMVIGLYSRYRYVPESPCRICALRTTFSLPKWAFEGESEQNSESSCPLSRNTKYYLLDSVMKAITVRYFSVQKYIFPKHIFSATAFIHYWVIKDSRYWNLKLKWVWAKKTVHIKESFIREKFFRRNP